MKPKLDLARFSISYKLIDLNIAYKSANSTSETINYMFRVASCFNIAIEPSSREAQLRESNAKL